MSDRRNTVNHYAQRAIRELRDAEDWARLELGDVTLATRFRECHECVTERVINGRYGIGLSRPKLNDLAEWVDRWAWETLPRRHEFRPHLDEGPARLGGVDLPQRVSDQQRFVSGPSRLPPASHGRIPVLPHR